MTILRPIACTVFGIFISGCSELRTKPAYVKTLVLPMHNFERAEKSKIATTTEPLENFRDAYAKAADDAARKQLRNRYAFNLLGMVDAEYSDFEKDLRSDRARKDVFVDWTSIALTAAATVTGTSHVKTILAAIDTGLKGANASVDKNVFQQKGTESLINQMRADRAAIADRIYVGLNKEVVAYPLEAMLRDIVAYYSAGSVTSALVSLANVSAAEADKNEKAANTSVKAIAQ